MDAFEKNTTVNDSKQPAKRTYRRRTVPNSKASSVNRRHGDRRNNTTHDAIIELPIKPTVPLSWILSSATQLLVDHLLYSRGLIPLSVAQLRDAKQEEVLKSHSQRRKVAQCRNRLDSWKCEWSRIDPGILEKCSCISISFGPSFLRSRESYILNVAEARTKMKKTASELPPVHALARRLLPSVLECDTELPNQLAPSYQLWVSMFVQGETLEEAFNEESNELANLVIRRPGYKLPVRGTTTPNQRVVYINILNADNGSESSSSSAAKKPAYSLGVTEGAHWISLRTSIKGFRLSA